MHHSDRGAQYASEIYRQLLAEHGLVGSMGRRGNPYDNAKAESFMKTLKVEAMHLMDTRGSKSTSISALHRQLTTRGGFTQPSAI